MNTFRRRCAALALLFFCLASLPAFARDIVIFYTSDTHGHIFPGEKTLGLDRVAGIVRATPGAILLDAGDFLHGKPAAVMSQGKDVVRLMKQAGYLAATAGNHEFDYGRETLERRRREAEMPPDSMAVLAANVFCEDGSPLLTPETEVVREGFRVCVFGLTIPATPKQAGASTVRGLRFASPFATGRAIAAAQKQRGCNLVVALTHIGSDPSDPENSRVLAAGTPGIDVVIDGHSHVVLNERPEQAAGQAAGQTAGRAAGEPAGALLVSPGAHGRLLGRLDVSLDDATGAVTGIQNRFIGPEQAALMPADQGLADALQRYRTSLDKFLAVPLGTLEADFPAEKREARLRETAFGDLCADVIRSAYNDQLALFNGGAIRAPLHKGEMTRGDLLAALPYADAVVSLEVTGRELLDILEHGFSRLPDPFGGFPQVSGFSVRVRPANPSGSRVVGVTLADGAPLEPDRVYTLGVSSFLAGGGDGYPHLAAGKAGKSSAHMEDLFLRFIRESGTAAYAGGPAGRIVLE